MHTRLAPLALALTLALALAVVGVTGCTREPTGTPEVVGETPPSEEPTASVEPTPTPLSAIAITLEPVVTGLDQPLFVTGLPDGSGRLVVLEKTGRAWLLADGERSAMPFLDLSGVVSTTSEQGLLGMAFSPLFGSDASGANDYVWVDYTRADGATVIASYHVVGDAVDPATEYVWLTIPQPYANHNGGMIAFGPDQMLYIGMGDGGSGGDPHGNGQNPASLLGKLLRINVLFDGTAVSSAPYSIPPDNPFAGQPGWAPEIWAWGLRNPWRFSFDRTTGDLWIGDVGQNAWEELDFQPADSSGGENYGWNLYEATHPYATDAAPSGDAYTMPVLEYDRGTGTSITGGYMYRGSEQASLWGTYFFADFSFGRIWGLQRAVDGTVQTRELADNDMLIASFGEDENGELYVVDLSGGVYRVVAR